MKSFVFTGLMTFLTISLCAAQGQKMSIVHDSLERSFYLHLPKGYSENNTYPMVLALHGGGGTAKQFNRGTRSRFNRLANEEGFILVYPQGIGKSWNDHPDREKRGEARKRNIDDVGFISAVIDHLSERFAVDTTKVFSCGISNGGLMSQTLAAELPNKIKAIGLVSANFSEIKAEEMRGGTPFSAIIIHGTEDPIFPYDEGTIIVFKQQRGAVLGAEKSMEFM